MPKLVHKKNVTRLKKYNYTERHDKLQKNLVEGKIYASKAEALRDAGYTKLNSSDNSKGVQELIKDWKLPQIAVSNIRRGATIEEDADKETRENVALKLKSSELILKLSGDLRDRATVDIKADINVLNEVVTLNETINALRTKPDRIDGDQSSS